MKQLRDMIRSGVTEDCSICLDDLRTPVITPCGHVYCRACIERVIQTQKPPACPLCRATIKKSQLLEAGQDEEEEDNDVAKKTAADMEDIKVSALSINRCTVHFHIFPLGRGIQQQSERRSHRDGQNQERSSGR